MILFAALLSKDKRFQELVLILNPMLEETFLKIGTRTNVENIVQNKLNPHFPKTMYIYSAKTNMSFEVNIFVIYIFI